ncbi:hypothetical protein B0H14DRAFT_2646682 [Mycena olivaceomarginata]|nr:hypothetical protein B0H14DRAFT_2646682 [Mycena olivaceomarginata]
MAFLNSGPSADMGTSSNVQAPILAFLFGIQFFSGPCSKRARQSRNTGVTGVGASSPGSPMEKDGFRKLSNKTLSKRDTSDPLDAVPDFLAQNSLPSTPSTTTNLFLSSYDNVLDDESSKNLLNRFQSLNLGIEYHSSTQLDLDSDYTVPCNILDDFLSPQPEILPDFLFHDPMNPTLVWWDLIKAEAQTFVEPDAIWWGQQDDEEMYLDANLFDSGGSKEDSGSMYAFYLDTTVLTLGEAIVRAISVL